MIEQTLAAAGRGQLPSSDGALALALGEGRDIREALRFANGAVAGVYTIGVVEEYRRQGLGEAMTGAVLRAGRDAGCQVGVLQSSEMGYPLYRSMGFETVVTYHHFEPAT